MGQILSEKPLTTKHRSVGTARSVEAEMKMTVREGRGTNEKSVFHTFTHGAKARVITKKGSQSHTRRWSFNTAAS